MTHTRHIHFILQPKPRPGRQCEARGWDQRTGWGASEGARPGNGQWSPGRKGRWPTTLVKWAQCLALKCPQMATLQACIPIIQRSLGSFQGPRVILRSQGYLRVEDLKSSTLVVRCVRAGHGRRRNVPELRSTPLEGWYHGDIIWDHGDLTIKNMFLISLMWIVDIMGSYPATVPLTLRISNDWRTESSSKPLAESMEVGDVKCWSMIWLIKDGDCDGFVGWPCLICDLCGNRTHMFLCQSKFGCHEFGTGTPADPHNRPSYGVVWVGLQDVPTGKRDLTSLFLTPFVVFIWVLIVFQMCPDVEFYMAPKVKLRKRRWGVCRKICTPWISEEQPSTFLGSLKQHLTILRNGG